MSSKLFLAVLFAESVGFALVLRHFCKKDKIRDQMVAWLSHELKSPLTSITALSQLMLKVAPEHKKSLSVILGSAATMKDLIDDVLIMGKMEAGCLKLNEVEQNIEKTANQVIDSYQPIAELRKITLDYSPPAPNKLRYDEKRITQVFGNLLSNAIKFTPKGGRISVKCKPLGTVLVFSVTDTGPGINPKDRKHVFDRYWEKGVPSIFHFQKTSETFIPSAHAQNTYRRR